jgi:hypothetical protein
MKEVKMFKTEDGQTFPDKMSATKHELMLSIRGIIQSHVKGISFSPTELATIMAKEQDQVFNTIGKFRRSMGSIKGASNKIGLQ